MGIPKDSTYSCEAVTYVDCFGLFPQTRVNLANVVVYGKLRRLDRDMQNIRTNKQ